MDVGVSEKTAWFLSHKILEVLGKAPVGNLFGILEADETVLAGMRSKGWRASNEQMVMAEAKTRPGERVDWEGGVRSCQRAWTFDDRKLHEGLPPNNSVQRTGLGHRPHREGLPRDASRGLGEEVMRRNKRAAV